MKFYIVFVILLSFNLVTSLTGCGVKGPPIPPVSETPDGPDEPTPTPRP